MTVVVVKIKGVAGVKNFLNAFPNKMASKVFPTALKAGMEPVLAAAKANVPKDTGKVSQGMEIAVKSEPNSENVRVTASVQTKGPHGYLAQWLEFGTQPHVIRARVKQALAIGEGRFVKVEHPGIKGGAFMRPALDSQSAAAVEATAESIRAQLAAGVLNEKGKLEPGEKPLNPLMSMEPDPTEVPQTEEG